MAPTAEPAAAPRACRLVGALGGRPAAVLLLLAAVVCTPGVGMTVAGPTGDNSDDDDAVPRLAVGQRVRRGPDWIWYKQDGVEGIAGSGGNPPGGAAGTVVEVVAWKDEPLRAVRVLWDANQEWNVYRWGAEGGKLDVEPVPGEPIVDLETIGWETLPLLTPTGACESAEREALGQLYRKLGGLEGTWRHRDGWGTLEEGGNAANMQSGSEPVCESAAMAGDGKCGETEEERAPAAMMMIDNLGQPKSIVRAAQGGYERPRREDASDPCLLPWEGIVCENGHVISIRLDRNGLQGSLAALTQIGALSHLRALDLSMNALQGNLDAFTALSQLRWLNVANNALDGPVPAALGELSALEWISVAHNRLSGPLPAALGQLQNLTFAFFSQNHLDVSRNKVPKELLALPKLAPRHPRLEGNVAVKL